MKQKYRIVRNKNLTQIMLRDYSVAVAEFYEGTNSAIEDFKELLWQPQGDDTKRLEWIFKNCKILITGMPFDITDRSDIDAAMKREGE